MFVLYLILYLIPVVFGIYFNLHYLPWLGSVLLVWFLSPRVGNSWYLIALKCLSNGVITFLNLMMASSLYLQGEGFNEQFFFHLDGATFAIAREAFPELFFGAWLLWFVQLGLFPFCRAAEAAGSSRAKLSLSGGLLFFVPLWSLAASLVDRMEPENQPSIDHGLISEIPLIAMEQKRSLLFIFAESLESTYSDTTVFEVNLTPELTKLEKAGLRFTDIQQKSYTGWTLG